MWAVCAQIAADGRHVLVNKDVGDSRGCGGRPIEAREWRGSCKPVRPSPSVKSHQNVRMTQLNWATESVRSDARGCWYLHNTGNWENGSTLKCTSLSRRSRVSLVCEASLRETRSRPSIDFPANIDLFNPGRIVFTATRVPRGPRQPQRPQEPKSRMRRRRPSDIGFERPLHSS